MQRTAFVPNLPMRHDTATNRLVPKNDINAAAAFGKLEILTQGPIEASDLQRVISAVAHAASRSHQSDLVVCIGDVVVMAVMIAAMGRAHGHANLLRWDRRLNSYQIIQIGELSWQN